MKTKSYPLVVIFMVFCLTVSSFGADDRQEKATV